MAPRHFLTLADLDRPELEALLHRAIAMKAAHNRGEVYQPLRNRVLGMVFEKASTRTRVSFEVAMAQLGGHAIFLSPRDTQLGRGEPIEDTARVLSRMVDVVMIRTFEHEKVERFAACSRVPVINALTDTFHPCQLLADMQTLLEQKGRIAGLTVAWIGDGNNMCNTYVDAAPRFGFKLRIACPPGFEPRTDLVEAAGDYVELVRSPVEAAQGADMVTTDVWTSMGQEEDHQRRLKAFQGFQVDDQVMTAAKGDAIFQHCLPAHRGEEVSASVIDGPQSAVWDQAENRLHTQKALLELLLVAGPR